MVPALFEATVRFFVPLRRTAAIRFSGTPHVPKPPERMTAPSNSLSIATSALATRLSIESDLHPLNAWTFFVLSLLHIAQNLVQFSRSREIFLQRARAKVASHLL